MNIIKIPQNTEIMVVSDLHAHIYQFNRLLELYPPNKHRIICQLGDLFDKGFETQENDAYAICDKLEALESVSLAYGILGNHCLKKLSKNKPGTRNRQLQWLSTLPLYRCFEFENGKRVLCIHSGVLPSFTEKDLEKNIEIVYIRKVNAQGKMIPLIWKMINGVNTLVEKELNGINWHELYDGRFGYICSGHQAQEDGIPKYYNYSCNLDCSIYSTGKLCVQFITGEGNLGKQIFIEGSAANPILNIKY